MEGVADAREEYANPSLADNECYKYANLLEMLYTIKVKL